jgi:hypothetical protein
MATKNRTLVKLDDTIIEITEGKKGFVAKRLSDDDLAEVTLLDEGVEKLIENDMNKLANETYAEIQEGFKAGLKENVLKVVGFDNRWSSRAWEVDHCNGRSSFITSYMSNKVQGMFREEFDKLLQPEIAKMIEPLKKAMVAEYKDVFTRTVRDSIREQAQVAAKDFLNGMIGSRIQKYQKQALAKAEQALMGRPVAHKDEPLDDE